MRRQDFQRRIDEEVCSHEHRIIELKTQRNSYACISMLPEELMVHIFMLVRGDDPFKKWRKITHICRHWRGIAVGTPILWTKPPTNDRFSTELMLGRSGTADLDIVIGKTGAATETIALISNHLERVRALTLSPHRQWIRDIYDGLIASGHPFSRLECLIVNPQNHEIYRNRMDWVPPASLIRQESSLHSLTIANVAFDWSLLPVHLTSLEIRWVELTQKISHKVLVQTLGTMPQLQHLDLSLDDKLLFPYDAPDAHINKAHLSRLESLCMWDRGSEDSYIAHILPWLKFSNLTSLNINGNCLKDLNSYSGHTLSQIETILANNKFPAVVSFHITNSNVSVSAFGTPCVVIVPPGFFGTRQAGAMSTTVTFARRFIPLFVGIVQITLSLLLSLEDLLELFGDMQQLKAISISECTGLFGTLTNLLKYRAGRHSQQSLRGHICPAMDTIGIQEMHWYKMDYDSLADLGNSIMQRSDHAAAITTLYSYGEHRIPSWLEEDLENGGVYVEVGEVPGSYGF